MNGGKKLDVGVFGAVGAGKLSVLNTFQSLFVKNKCKLNIKKLDKIEEQAEDMILFLVYSIDSKSSFDYISSAISETKKALLCVLIGNKLDLNENREVSLSDAKQLGVPYHFEVSSLTKANFGDLISRTIELFRALKGSKIVDLPKPFIPALTSLAEPHKLSITLEKIFNDPKYSDYAVVFGEKRIYLHKIVIMTRCSSILENIPKDQTEFKKDGLSYEWTYCCLKWVYTGLFHIPENPIWEDLKAVVWSLGIWHLAPLTEPEKRKNVNFENNFYWNDPLIRWY
eukprot:TRINITY_DN20621_c0_g1_i1.p1 TRINITY_DN20621_c0_g1~~TRINITY_DN20621_c0_g1_i1.p1  ORF type:complete len:284 (+),score=82.10 TRINITY_DN20621_c0_g1_i1:61-912(+)